MQQLKVSKNADHIQIPVCIYSQAEKGSAIFICDQLPTSTDDWLNLNNVH